jgi:hypothetical protein
LREQCARAIREMVFPNLNGDLQESSSVTAALKVKVKQTYLELTAGQFRAGPTPALGTSQPSSSRVKRDVGPDPHWVGTPICRPIGGHYGSLLLDRFVLVEQMENR